MTTVAERIEVFLDNDRPDLSGRIPLVGQPSVSGLTAALSAQGSATGEFLINHEPVTIDSASSTEIVWSYGLQPGDYSKLGSWTVYVTLTYSDGDIQDVVVGQLVVSKPNDPKFTRL